MVEKEERPGLRDVAFRLGYDTADEALREFYIPALGRSIHYDRSVGYFRASSLAVAARGVSRFIAGGGTMRLLVGAEVGENDRKALEGAIEIPAELAERLRSELVPEDEVARRRLEVLGWLAREGRLKIRVAIAVDADGKPLPSGDAIPYFHEKIGVLRDHRGDGVAFQGSVNESATAWTRNFESFSVYRSWDSSAPYFDMWAAKFEQRWGGKVPRFRIFELPDAIAQELVSYASDDPPPTNDPEEPLVPANRGLLARFLSVAPRLIGADALAEATTGVTPFPHQRQVVERLAGEYPRSWLVADEVGLGKTISAGLALRRLLLSGQIKRALVLAPANVCRQWQDELFEKFGIWANRFDGHQILGPHPGDGQKLSPGTNPYDLSDILIVSSHLARRADYQRLLVNARAFDLLIVDEAHHARRQGFFDINRYRPSRLMQLLDLLGEKDLLAAVWLLTATPMQVHPIELRDLLRYVGLTGSLANWENFERFYAELAKEERQRTDWSFVARMLATTPVAPAGRAEQAFLTQVETKLGPVQRGRVERFGRPGDDSEAIASDLGASGRKELRAWLRLRSPIGQLVTRHTRQTLKWYRAQGLLKEPVADRAVKTLSIPFSQTELDLYDDLETLLDRLMEAHQSRRGAGFVLTVYRRRLTSSWEAIRHTLIRRLSNESLAIEMDLLEEAEAEEAAGLDTGDGNTVDDAQAVPLSQSDLEEMRSYVTRIELVEDSKFDQLVTDLNHARGSGQAAIVFTQFADTLDHLCARLSPMYRSQLATYTGNGGRQFRENEGWVAVSKQSLVEALNAGSVTVLLATDAASEGLNLQSCSYLVNYDLPWNPMRVEQRIGRIDRIGQRRPIITVRNYVIPNTVEERVYDVLATRIDIFNGLVGNLQPILGATEAAFRTIFRTPRSERGQIQVNEIKSLLTTVSQLEQAGIDISIEDPLPMPVQPPSPLTLRQFQEALVELDISLDSPDHPATTDPERASRDPENWAALITYGHPKLRAALEHAAGATDEGPVVFSSHDEWSPVALVRADRAPPVVVSSLTELDDMGAPIALGDAEELARQLATTAAEERIQAYTQVLSRRQVNWQRSVQMRFQRLVLQAVGTQYVVATDPTLDAIEPMVAWMDLTREQLSGWQYAETFRRALSLSLDSLLPGVLVPVVHPASPEQIRRARTESGQALLELMQEWKHRSSPALVATPD